MYLNVTPKLPWMPHSSNKGNALWIMLWQLTSKPVVLNRMFIAVHPNSRKHIDIANKLRSELIKVIIMIIIVVVVATVFVFAVQMES